MKLNPFILIPAAFYLLSCGPSNGGDTPAEPVQQKPGDIPYDFDDPSEVYELEDELKEISGLTFDAGSNSFWTISDDEKMLYQLSMSGVIIKEYELPFERDFEGIHKLGDAFFILSSWGDLYEFHLEGDKAVQQRHWAGLSKANEPEGLCASQDGNALLIACKGWPGLGNNAFGAKAVFAFDLEKWQREEEPRYQLSFREMGKKRDVQAIPKPFSPSGIAVHPESGDVYVISAVDEWIAVLSEAGEVKYATRFDVKNFRQPEGITFDSHGTLYVASEGQGGKAKLAVFHKK